MKKDNSGKRETGYFSDKNILFINPDKTSSPTDTSLNKDSPVSADVSIILIPSTTVPSKGIFSPGFTTIKSPTSTSVAPRKMTVEDLQMLEKEKQLLMAELEKAEHQQNAYAYQELKHLILVNGSASIELAQAKKKKKV